MKKVGVFLGVIALLSLAYAAGSFAQNRELPWNLIRGIRLSVLMWRIPKDKTWAISKTW